jgi:uncharacterized protein (DUF2235 family)
MGKRIVICCDGTWNEPDQINNFRFSPTNVTKIARAIAPISSNGKEQIVFYLEGVGADQWGFDRLAAGGAGLGLDANIAKAYRHLARNYHDGDEVFLFGFSRGAYTSRSVVGLIRNSGLLKKSNLNKFSKAYRLYKNDDLPDTKKIKRFRKKYSREIEIKFIGVWDTVGSLGIPVLEEGNRKHLEKINPYYLLSANINIVRILTKQHYEFHDVELSSIVKFAYHALAIDEKRASFKQTLWKKRKSGQKIEQVWFPGVHGDIGGGYSENGLSDIAFLWMKQKAEDCGLEFDSKYIKSEIHPDYTEDIHISKKGIFDKFKDSVRRIGYRGVGQAIHPAAKKKFEDKKCKYKPDNLKKYLKSPKCKIAEDTSWH